MPDLLSSVLCGVMTAIFYGVVLGRNLAFGPAVYTIQRWSMFIDPLVMFIYIPVVVIRYRCASFVTYRAATVLMVDMQRNHDAPSPSLSGARTVTAHPPIAHRTPSPMDTLSLTRSIHGRGSASHL